MSPFGYSGEVNKGFYLKEKIEKIKEWGFKWVWDLGEISKEKTKTIKVGSVEIGGDSPISVQSMTNTLTTDIDATVSQINSLVEEGADIVRVSCPDKESTESLKEVVNQSSVPIVADIHFHYKRAIEAAEAGAACLRVNPGNIGKEKLLKWLRLQSKTISVWELELMQDQ